MSGTRNISKTQADAILADAVRDQQRLVVTHHTSQGWRLLKGRFVVGSLSAESVTAEIAPGELPADAQAPASQDAIGCTFRAGHRKCMFGAGVLSVERAEDTLRITFQRPRELQQLQRRAFERVPPPKGAVIAVRFWRQSEDAVNPDQRTVRHGQLEDISAGGMRIRVPDPKDIELDVSYRCVFTPRQGRPAFLLDAMLRHRAAVEDGRTCLGFQFIGLETTTEGRDLLDRLARFVAHLHRARQPKPRARAASPSPTPTGADAKPQL